MVPPGIPLGIPLSQSGNFMVMLQSSSLRVILAAGNR